MNKKLVFLLGMMVASLGWLALLWKDTATIEIDALDAFFVLTTFVSLTYNVVQHQRDKGRFDPIRDGLVGLFNDLKGRSLRCYARNLAATNALGRGEQLQVREFLDFVEETNMGLEQVREHVMALIQSVAPNLSEDKVFKASSFGLDKHEKELREIWGERHVRQARTPVPEVTMAERALEGLRAAAPVPAGLQRTGDRTAGVTRPENEGPSK